MKKKTLKVLLSITTTLGAALPALANMTSLTINADVIPVVSLRIEKQSDGVIVSGDNVDPGAFGTSENEVLDFGQVTPFATTVGAMASQNGTSAANLKAMEIDKSYRLYSPDNNQASGQPHNASGQPLDNKHFGAVYFLPGALQLRALRNTNGSNQGEGPTDVSVNSTGSLTSIVCADNTDFSAGKTLSQDIFRAPANDPTTLVNGLAHDTGYPITVGVHIPFSQGAGATTTVITFTGV